MSLDKATIEAIIKNARDYFTKIEECAKKGHPGGDRVWGVGSFSKLCYCPTCNGYYELSHVPLEDFEWAEKIMHVQVTI